MISAAHKKLHFPGDVFKAIHIAGTNGKGTVALNIAKGLEKEGYKTALFSSPHFMHITERISINGKDISFDRMEKIYQENKSILEFFHFFDLLTLIAYIYFAEEKVDYGVIEAGIGGLKDSTNIITPNLCVITNISNDHSGFLGNTIDAIAESKAGIIKKKVPIVLGFHATLPAIYEVAKKQEARVIAIEKSSSDFLIENKTIADAALMELGIFPVTEIFTPPGRFEVHGNIIFDMAHNEAAFLSLKRKMVMTYPGKKIIALWNIARDKEVSKCLDILRSFTKEVYFYFHENPRLLSNKMAHKLGVKEYKGEKGDIILVCGSISFLAKARKSLFSLEQ